MSGYNGEERRQCARKPLTSFCPTRFKAGGKEFDTLMINVSEGGACFQADEIDPCHEFERGQACEFEVKTPYGLSQGKGTIAWYRMIDNVGRWGVAFTEVSHDAQDPLWAFVNASF
jgi:hypothetical protein